MTHFAWERLDLPFLRDLLLHAHRHVLGSGKREHGTSEVGPGRVCVPSRDTALSSEKQEV